MGGILRSQRADCQKLHMDCAIDRHNREWSNDFQQLCELSKMHQKHFESTPHGKARRRIAQRACAGSGALMAGSGYWGPRHG